MKPKPKSLYDELMALPDNIIGEILNSELYTQPRPGPKHAIASTRLGADIDPAYGRGRGGPGGWWIIYEPEVHLATGDIVVPDIAGWQKSRMPELPETAYFDLAPDWICEVLSPGTAKTDRTVKMPIYAKNAVSYLWLVDPIEKILEAYELLNSKWLLLSAHKDNDKISLKPFDQITIALDELWG